MMEKQWEYMAAVEIADRYIIIMIYYGTPCIMWYSPQQENTGHDEKALHCTSILLAQNMKQLIKFKSIGRKSTFYLPIGSMYAIYGNVYHQYPQSC